MTYLKPSSAFDRYLSKSLLNNLTDYQYVMNILLDVAKRGNSALIEYTSRPPPFDNVKLKSIDVSEEEFKGAYEMVDDLFIDTVKIAIRNIRKVHNEQFRFFSRELSIEVVRGINYLQLVRPIERVGVLVPGGMASYPSSLLMGVIPAQVAGVNEIIVATPPKRDSSLSPYFLVAADLLGIRSIIRCNQIAAVAALAFGTESITPVDKIVGPGNMYVCIAKLLVASFGVDIDMPAGPSEIAVVADGSSNPVVVAWELASQAEHSPDCKVFLITDSEKLVKEVRENLKRISRVTGRAEIIDTSLQGSSVFFYHSIDEAVEICNRIAPEHLSLQLDESLVEKFLNGLKNCGTVYVGPYSPCAAGDYITGSNHILPTGGFARVRGPLSVLDFLKFIPVQRLSRKALRELSPYIQLFAKCEGLYTHAESVSLHK